MRVTGSRNPAAITSLLERVSKTISAYQLGDKKGDGGAGHVGELVNTGFPPGDADALDAEARRIAAELVRLFKVGTIRSVGDAVSHARAIVYTETCSQPSPELGGPPISGNELPRAILEVLDRAGVE